MSKAADYQEIQRARALIELNGFSASGHENGHLIVKDPIHRSGAGAQAGMLITAGFQDVAVRSYSDAVEFVAARA